MNKTCANCKFWSVWWPKVCDRITLGVDKSAYIQAEADDDQGLGARLVTPGNFGCTLFVDANQKPESEDDDG